MKALIGSHAAQAGEGDSTFQHYSMCRFAVVSLVQEALRSLRMRRLLQATASAWRRHVDDKCQLAAMCMRISGWHAQRRLRRMFAAWLRLTQLEHLSRQQQQVVAPATPTQQCP